VRLGIDAHASEREGEGNSTYIRGLIRALPAVAGESDLVLFASDPRHPFYRTLAAGARFRIRAFPLGGGFARIAWGLGRAATREGVDCLHVQYFAPLGYRGPLVVTVHDLGFLHVPRSFPPGLRLALRLLVPWSATRATRVVTTSEFSRHDVQRRYGLPPEKVVVVPAGVGSGFHRLDDAATRRVLGRYGLEPGFVFTLGRLNRRKNLGRLVRAHQALRTDGVSGAPLVIGGKPDYASREIRRRTGPDAGSVRWVGLIPDQDLAAFYSGAACFVYPSLFEGFGLPVLEAMACGCPVVSSDRAALPELVHDAGVLVDAERVDVLAAAIARVLGDPALRAELGGRGLARSRELTWERAARRMLGAYHQAVHGAGPP
jgi:glycosyltransferase involved in cell wall biosynthesis